MLSAIRDGLRSNQVDAKFVRRYLKPLSQTIPTVNTFLTHVGGHLAETI
jgi:hypothetical protein